jgi:hypothetical protein
MPINQSDLDNFYGTEQYYKNFTGLIYTDGIKYLADNANSYWLIDAVGSHIKTNPSLRKNGLQDFQLWQLKKISNNDNTYWELTCRSDTDNPPVITQIIEYSDFPFDNFEWYVEGGVMLLKSEH